MRKWIFGCLLVCGFGAVQIASADTINLGAAGWDANATLSTSGGASGTFELDLSFVNTSGATVDINSFAIQLFGAGASEAFGVTSATLNGGSLGVWEYTADTKLNNGSSPSCDTQSVGGWLCVDTGSPTVNPYSLDSGATAAFIFQGNYSNTSAVTPLDLMASGCLAAGTCKLDGGLNDGNKWAVSAPLTGTSPVPEPGTLVLLGSGLLVMAMLLKRG